MAISGVCSSFHSQEDVQGYYIFNELANTDRVYAPSPLSLPPIFPLPLGGKLGALEGNLGLGGICNVLFRNQSMPNRKPLGILTCS